MKTLLELVHGKKTVEKPKKEDLTKELATQLALAKSSGQLGTVLSSPFYTHLPNNWINFPFFDPLYQYQQKEFPISENQSITYLYQLYYWLMLINPSIQSSSKQQMVCNYALSLVKKPAVEPPAATIARELDIVHPLIGFPFLFYADKAVISHFIYLRHHYRKVTEQPPFLEDHLRLLMSDSPYSLAGKDIVAFLEILLTAFAQLDKAANVVFPNDHRTRAYAAWTEAFSPDQYALLSNYIEETSHAEHFKRSMSYQSTLLKNVGQCDLSEHCRNLQNLNPELNLLVFKQQLKKHQARRFMDDAMVLTIFHLDLIHKDMRRKVWALLSKHCDSPTQCLVDYLNKLIAQHHKLLPSMPQTLSKHLIFIMQLIFHLPMRGQPSEIKKTWLKDIRQSVASVEAKILQANGLQPFIEMLETIDNPPKPTPYLTPLSSIKQASHQGLVFPTQDWTTKNMFLSDSPN